MTWKEFVHYVVGEHCEATGTSTVTLSDLYNAHGAKFKNFRSTNNHPRRKVEQVFQQLRDDGVLSFVDNKGTYRLDRPK